MEEQRSVHVDFVADVVCPWCYLGWRSLRMAIDERPHLNFDIVWRPFMLDPNAPAAGMDRTRYYEERFGDADKFKEMEAGVVEAATAFGAPLNLAAQKVRPNTVDAHRVIVWAFGEGRRVDAVEKMFAAYFVEGKNLSDFSVLAEIGADLGLDRETIREALRGDSDRDIVINSHNSCIKMGIGGVPALIFDNKTAAMGCQPPEEYLKAIDQAIA